MVAKKKNTTSSSDDSASDSNSSVYEAKETTKTGDPDQPPTTGQFEGKFYWTFQVGHYDRDDDTQNHANKQELARQALNQGWFVTDEPQIVDEENLSGDGVEYPTVNLRYAAKVVPNDQDRPEDGWQKNANGNLKEKTNDVSGTKKD